MTTTAQSLITITGKQWFNMMDICLKNHDTQNLPVLEEIFRNKYPMLNYSEVVRKLNVRLEK